MSSAAFRAFSCERFDTGREFLRADLSVECSTATHVSEAHEAVKELAFAAIMLYPVGISLMYMFAFACARSAIRENRSTRLSQAITFLSRDFEPEYLWWEARSCISNHLAAVLSVHGVVSLSPLHFSRSCVLWQLIETWKKLVLVGFLVLLKPGSLLQVISAFVVSASFSLLVGVSAPYKETSDNYFAKACSYALTMLFFFVTVLKVGVLTEQLDNVLTDELRYRYSFDAAFVSAGMMVSIIGTLPLATVMAAHRLLQAAQIGEAARCSDESSVASTVRQSPEGSSARAELMHGWPSWVTSFRSRSTRRSDIRQGCPTQKRISGPRGPGSALATSAKALNLKRALNLVRFSRTNGLPNTVPNESEAPPETETPLQPSSQGKLKDRKARLKARRDSLTAGDELYKDSSGNKEWSGRLVSRRQSSSKSPSCSASTSPRDGGSCGASTFQNGNQSVRV